MEPYQIYLCGILGVVGLPIILYWARSMPAASRFTLSCLYFISVVLAIWLPSLQWSKQHQTTSRVLSELSGAFVSKGGDSAFASYALVSAFLPLVFPVVALTAIRSMATHQPPKTTWARMALAAGLWLVLTKILGAI